MLTAQCFANRVYIADDYDASELLNESKVREIAETAGWSGK